MNKLIHIPMSPIFRLQNLRFKPDGSIFWTSGSKSIFQKIKRFLTSDKSELGNSSDGVIYHHGQEISENPVNGKYMYFKSKNSSHFAKQQKGHGYLQGIFGNVAVFGKPSETAITVKTVSGAKVEVHYKNHVKWFWKHWEAEGIARDKHGNLWIGINIKVKYIGIQRNYRLKIDEL